MNQIDVANTTRQPHSTIKIEENSTRTVVTLVPAQKEPQRVGPILTGLVFGGIGGFIGLAFTSATHNPIYLLGGLGFGVGMGMLSNKQLNTDPRGRVFATRIEATQDRIEAQDENGAAHIYNAKDIARLLCRQTYNVVVGRTQMFGRPTVATIMGNAIENAGANSRQKRADWYAERSFVVELEAKGKRVVLANGLDEPTAFAAYQAISRQVAIPK
jgi:hypothetical protein